MTALPLAALLCTLAGLFDYDGKLPYEIQTELSKDRTDVRISGGSMQVVSGRRMDFVLVEPAAQAPRKRAAVLFQHGGGQNILTYVSEAILLAKAGAVSLIAEAPYRFTAEEQKHLPKGPDLRDGQARIIISLRRALDWLAARSDVDRLAFVGHSYGGNAGAVLADIDRRPRAFVLIGLTARYSRHVEDNQAQFWTNYRSALTAAELAETVQHLREVDPDQFLPRAVAPVLIQCGRFDTEDVKRECELAHAAASQPKLLRWYECDHDFADVEATLDRLLWLGDRLGLDIRSVLKRRIGRH